MFWAVRFFSTFLLGGKHHPWLGFFPGLRADLVRPLRLRKRTLRLGRSAAAEGHRHLRSGEIWLGPAVGSSLESSPARQQLLHPPEGGLVTAELWICELHGDLGDEWKTFAKNPWVSNVNGCLELRTAYGGGSKPITINFSGMNIYLQAILRFTRGTSFWPIAISVKIFQDIFQCGECPAVLLGILISIDQIFGINWGYVSMLVIYS